IQDERGEQALGVAKQESFFEVIEWTSRYRDRTLRVFAEWHSVDPRPFSFDDSFGRSRVVAVTLTCPRGMTPIAQHTARFLLDAATFESRRGFCDGLRPGDVVSVVVRVRSGVLDRQPDANGAGPVRRDDELIGRVLSIGK